MPHLDKITRFEITPEQFLKACSNTEIIEVSLLLQAPRYSAIVNQLDLFEDAPQTIVPGPLSHFKHS